MRSESGESLRTPGNWRMSLPFLALCVTLLGVAVFLIGTSLSTGGAARVSAVGNANAAEMEAPIAAEAGAFNSATAGAPSARQRHLDTYYERRAYPGAPPYIPHTVGAEQGAWGQLCNACHQAGGFSAEYDAYAPLTPHPQFSNCRQCHVAQQEGAGAFRGNSWQKIAGPALGQAAIAGGPPMIPHSLQLRGNCVACHAGQGAVDAIETSHPERGNCRQCHVPAQVNTAWTRP